MEVTDVTPILNVSEIGASVGWFEQLGWERGFTWNDGGPIEGAADADANGPANFGSVCCGDAQIFLCRDGQGAPGGVWLSWWLATPAEVDAVHETAVEHGMTVTWPPTDEPWGVREFHLRHPEGHTFRIGAALREA
jgi:Glyoxalase/Bleomycin resistance protein/Dioxygenase superfamily